MLDTRYIYNWIYLHTGSRVFILNIIFFYLSKDTETDKKGSYGMHLMVSMLLSSLWAAVKFEYCCCLLGAARGTTPYLIFEVSCWS